MAAIEPEKLLALIKDPNQGSAQIATAAGVSRDDAARAARLVTAIAKAPVEEVLALPPSLAAAVVRAAFLANRADVVVAAAESSEKEIAKEAKRAMHLFKSRGVALPEPKRVAPAPVPLTPEAEMPCYVSALDGYGERAVWISRVLPGRGIEIGQAVVSDADGITSLQVGLLGRKEFRAFTSDLEARGTTMGVREVSRDEAKALVAAARRQNDASGKHVPESADPWLGRLGPAGDPPDPRARFVAGSEAEEAIAVEGSARLHELPLFRGWLAEEEALRALAQKLDEISVSPLYIDERQRAEQARHALSAAMEAYFTAERKVRLSSRLFDMAWHLAEMDDAVGASLAASAARAIGGGPADRVPFARRLFEKAFPGLGEPLPEPGPPATGEPPAEATAPAEPLIIPGR
jgi:hypothetical protein